MMRKLAPLLLAAVLALVTAGCGSSSNNDGANAPSAIPESSAPSSQPSATASHSSEPSAGSAGDNTAQPSGSSEQALKDAASTIVELLRDRDLGTLSDWVDPGQGLRFSPYSHIDTAGSQLFQADKLPDFKDTAKLQWGTADGSGEPILLTFRDYYEKYVYNQDFADAPNVSVNALVGQGTTAFNAAEVYPGSSYVEFHFPGFDEKAEGMDWQSLVLVFVPAGEEWKLVSVVHGQWTI
ncbi:hypothetical protein [Cohnella sp. GCM10027633]|uniref:hypothetical protein n=1 Tax=unclassified Cohnella TaxID=2636738 RepID=UPI00363852CB